MQLNMIGNYRSFQVQNHNPAAWMRGKVQQNAKAQDVFGAQCKVTISREGRKLSKESQEEAAGGFAVGSAQRRLLRTQEQAETEQKEQTSILDEISNLMSEIRNCSSGGGGDTIDKKQEALQRLIDLKARQEEENKQRAETAASSAAAASKGQQAVDQKNADLYMMLKSFEEQEDDGESAGKGSDGKSSGAAKEEQKLGSVGEQFEHAASMLGVSAARREMQATAAIDELMNDGYDRIARSNAMMQEVQAEINLAMEAAGRENLSEEERRELVSGHMESASGMMKSNYTEMMNLRRSGIQETKDARDLELEHIRLNPLDGVAQVKQTILDSGVDAALNEVSQGTIEKASDELEQRVQELIDRRNEITSDADEREETQETAEKTDQIIMEKDEEQDEEAEVLLKTE
ncbi:MAG: hypothetical protein K2L86_02050 [Lachnospiraceae bacterium]|nr:hypothetical protein [Lachnospiraceae bacterium]